ncbi:MAG: hypothetical protein GF411_19225 [Candidatus Lokiarchaeota archaeon]|nr:hypothetical protein [Candidatus Lokiarchaeota archaeon]
MTSRGSYLVKFVEEIIEFPDKCPVCGDEVTTIGSVGIVLPIGGDFKDISRGWSTSPLSGTGQQLGRSEVLRVNVPVCEKHHSTPEKMYRIKRFATLFAGLGTLLLIMSSFFLVSTIIFQAPIFPPFILLFFISVVLSSFGYYFLRLSPLEKSVMIYKGASSGSMITLQIKPKWYALKLLELNPTALPLKVVRK